MLAIPSDYTVIGTVLAIAVAILLLSGLALYVAFRIRETLHDEKGGSARGVKVAFLIGLLFLSGGVFYFFASGFSGHLGPTGTVSTSSSNSSTQAYSTTSDVSTTTSASSTSASISTQTSASSSSQGQVTMSKPSCDGSRVAAGSTFTCTISIYNSGTASYSSATIISGGDFTKFTFTSCTEQVNGGPTTSVPTSGGTVNLGTLPPGSTVLVLTVTAPTQQGQDSNSMLTLNAVGLSQSITVTFTIQVTA